MKGILLLFDLATIGLVMGLLCSLRLPPTRALAYAWCPLVLKEFANTGHLDSIAVCLTTATLWLITRPTAQNSVAKPAWPGKCHWLAAGLWAAAILAKLYLLVLAPVLFMHWWRRFSWRTGGLAVVAASVLCAGYFAIPRTPKIAAAAAPEHTSFTGLGEFLEHWEINDLLFSVVFENVRGCSFPGSCSCTT